MHRRREWLFGILTVSFFGILIFGGAESYFRFFNPQLPAFLRPDPVVGTMHFSEYTVRQNNTCIRAVTRFNQEGMHDIDHTKPKPTGVYRIAVIGDSYVEAMQSSLEQSFFKVMEQQLRDRGYSVEVLAFGVGGFGTLQEYYLLRDYALQYTPDLVILAFTSGNDVRNNSLDLEKSLDMPYAVLREDQSLEFSPFMLRQEYTQAFQSPLRTLIFERSHVVRFLYRLSNYSNTFRNLLAFFHLHTPVAKEGQVKDVSEEVYFVDVPQAWSQSWEVTEALIRKMRDDTKANDASFLLFSLSNDVQLSETAFQKVQQKNPGVELNAELPEQRLSALADRNRIPYLSALPWMRDLDATGVVVHPVCHGHWSVEASRVAGEHLSDFVAATFLKQE